MKDCFTEVEKLDDALEEVGGFKRWHIAIFVLLGISNNLPWCTTGLIIVFSGWEPPYHCKVPDNDMLNLSLPFQENGFDRKYSKCLMYENYTSESNTTVQCRDGWLYNNSGYRTLVTEFDLVCEKDYYIDLGQTMHSMGALAATFVVGYLTDRFGRKRIHIIGLIGTGLLGWCTALSPTYWLIVAFRILTAVFSHISGASSMVLIMELYSTKRRSFIGIGYEIFWVFCYMLTLLFGYYIHDWRVLQFSFSSLNFLLVLCFPWCIPESVSWLVAKGRYKEAEASLKRMAKVNKVPVKDSYLNLEYQPIATGDPEEETTNEMVKMQNDKDILKPFKEKRGFGDNNIEMTEMSSQITSKLVQYEPVKNGIYDNTAFYNDSSDEYTEFEQCNFTKTKAYLPLQSCNSIEMDLCNESSCKHPEEAYEENRSDATSLSTNKDELKQFNLPGESIKKGVPIKQLFCDPKLRLHVIVFFGFWFSNSLIYGGLTLSSPTFGTNRFLTFGLLGIIELPVYILTVPLMNRFGRKIPLMMFFVTAGFPLGLLTLTDNSTIEVILVVIGKLGITGSYAVMLLYVNELFPADLRTTGYSLSCIGGIIGGQLSPLAAYMEKQIPWIPNLLFGIFGVGAGLLVLLLPETLNKPMALTTKDIHEIFYPNYNNDEDHKPQ